MNPLNHDLPVHVNLGDDWAVRVDRWWDPEAQSLRVTATPIHSGDGEGLAWEISPNQMAGYLAALRHVRELVFARCAVLGSSGEPMPRAQRGELVDVSEPA